MPWKETNKMEQKELFIKEMLKQDRPFKHLCAQFGISEKTGHKWKNRFYEMGRSGLEEESRNPTHSNQIDGDTGTTLTAGVEAGGAYPVPVEWKREFALTENRLTVTDEFSLAAPGEVTLCLHTLSRPEIDGVGFRVTRRGVTLVCRPAEGIDCPPEITDEFDVGLNEGEPEEYAQEMPPQYHIRYRLPSDRRRVTLTFSVSGKPES